MVNGNGFVAIYSAFSTYSCITYEFFKLSKLLGGGGKTMFAPPPNIFMGGGGGVRRPPCPQDRRLCITVVPEANPSQSQIDRDFTLLMN